jgi:hypothetical protein
MAPGDCDTESNFSEDATTIPSFLGPSGTAGLPFSTTTLPDVAEINARPPFPNFPLPRELRDEIYAYLLDHRRLPFRLAPDGSPNAALLGSGDGFSADPDELLGGKVMFPYGFHVGILGVNSWIRQESLELLRKANRFVYISLHLPVMEEKTLPFHVPIVHLDLEGHASMENMFISRLLLTSGTVSISC